MNRWNQCRLIDILSNIDLSLLEGHFPEADLENVKRIVKKRHGKPGMWIAVIAGLAAGSAALAGAFAFFCRAEKQR